MKRAVILIFALTLVSVSCKKNDFSLESQGIKESVTLSATVETQSNSSVSTKTSLAYDLSVIWESGDAISVLSKVSEQSNNDKFDIKSGIGTSNATFGGDLSDAAQYYVIYPYNEDNQFDGDKINFKIPQHQTYKAGSFAQNTNIMYASFTKNDMLNIQFKNLCGILNLQLTGESVNVTKIALSDNSGKMIWGDASVTPGSTIEDVAGGMTIKNGNNTIYLDGISGITLSSTPVSFDFVVPVGSFTNGFTAYVYTDKGVYSFFSSDKDNTVNRSKIRQMPPKETAAPTEYNLSAKGHTANTYVVVAKGSYKFTPTVGNSTLVEGITNADILWETENTEGAPNAGCIIKSGSVRFENGVILFEATGKAGNAAIAAYDNKNEILYSWHIWSTAEPIELAKYQSGAVFMDRNLGAASKVAGDTKAAGFLYQWGRCNPFPGTASFSADYTPIAFVPAFSDETHESSGKPSPDRFYGSYEYTDSHPQEFIAYDNNSQKNWRANKKTDGWSMTKKTKRDPCPWGYKVPEYKDFNNIEYTTNISLNSNIHGCYINGSNYYPITGATSGENKNVFWIVAVQGASTKALCASATANVPTNEKGGQVTYYPLVSGASYNLNSGFNFAAMRSIRCVKFEEPETTIGGSTESGN